MSRLLWDDIRYLILIDFSASDDNLFAGPESEPTGKISVKLPVD